MQGSIKSNTNRIVSSSDADWGSLRDGTIVKFDNDINYYHVGNTKNFYLIKDFVLLNSQTIKINGDIDINIFNGDTLTISYKEYELSTINNSIDNGRFYKIGDILTLKGGIPCINTINGEKLYCKLVVINVDENGSIKQLKLETAGKYTTPPNEEVELVGGSGEGAKIKAEYILIDNRSIVEKSVVSVKQNISDAHITIDSPLPEGVEKGKVSINKWEINLTSQYVGETKIGEKLEFIRNFSPNLNIPLLLKGNNSPELIYNYALLNIDKAIGQLQKEIDILKTKIR